MDSREDIPIVDLEREEIEDARSMSGSSKMELGVVLFEEVCERMRQGIRNQFPGISPAEETQELRRRLAISRMIENEEAAWR